MENIKAEILDILLMDMESFANLQEMVKVPKTGSDKLVSTSEQELWEAICSLVDSGAIVALRWNGQAYEAADLPVTEEQRADYWFARAKNS